MTIKEKYEAAKTKAEELHRKVGDVMINGTHAELRKAQDARRDAEIERDELYKFLVTEKPV